MTTNTSSCTTILDDAIGCMSYGEKEAFLEVIERNPNIVMKETDPYYMLQFESYNIWVAAKRITNYWNWKKRIFGPERYVLSLFDISGTTGALNAEDIVFLNTGYVSNVPPDNDGTSVLLFDRSQLGSVNQDWELIDPYRHYRIAFYAIAVAAEEQKQRIIMQQQQHCETTIVPSFILINLIHTMPKFIHNVKDFADMVYETSPVRLKYNHTMFLTQSDYAAFFLRMVIPTVERNLRRVFPTLTLSLFCSITEAHTKLQQLGFRTDSLPSSLGGTWQFTIPDKIIKLTSSTSSSGMIPSSSSPTRMDQSLLQQQQQQPKLNSSFCLRTQNQKQQQQQLLSTSSSTIGTTQDGILLPHQQQQQIEIIQQQQVSPTDGSFLYNFIQYNNNKETDQVQKHIQSYTELRQKLFRNRSNLPITQTGCKFFSV